MDLSFFTYPVLKALHIIFVVTWFAGLFYIVRLFVYHTEAQRKEEPAKEILTKQFTTMENRLWYGITWPSAILTFIFGFWLVYSLNYWLQPFMLLKFGFVFGLLVYHLYCGRLLTQLKKGVFKHSSFALRLINEIATLFLVAIVFVIVLKDTLSWIWGLIGIGVIAIVLMIAVKVYKSLREKKGSDNEEAEKDNLDGENEKGPSEKED